MITVRPYARRCFISALVFVIPFLGGVGADAATYYVAKTGNDAVNCATAQSVASPKLTVNAGLGCLTAAGDTLFIRTGTYVTDIFYGNLPVTGMPGSPITISRYQNEVVTLAPGGSSRWVILVSSSTHDITFNGFILDGTSSASGSGSAVFGTDDSIADNITISNMEIKNGPGGGIHAKGNNFRVLNTTVHTNGWATDYHNSNGLYLEGITNGLIQDVITYDNECFGLRMFSSDGAHQANNNIVERVTSHTNGTGKGLGGTATCASSGGGFVIGDIGNTLRNSIAYNNNQYGILVFKGGGNSNLNKLFNNTIYNSVNGIVVQRASVTNTTFTNNLSASNSASNYVDAGTGTVETSNRIGGVITDCTVSTANFRLKAGAPCIDAGTTIVTITSDFAGALRPHGGAYDIGAYEASGTDTEEPQAPRGLIVR